MSSLKRKEDNLLNLFVKKLKEELGTNLGKIILFGSRARGDNSSESDYDFAIVLNNISPSLNDVIDDITGKFLYEYNAVFSVFPISENRYRQQVYNPLLMNIEKEGIIL